MVELLSVVLVVALVAGALLGAFVLVVGLFKLTLKLVLLPLWLGWVVLKGMLLLLAGLVALAVAGPIVLGVGLVLLVPLLVLGGIVWLGVAAAT